MATAAYRAAHREESRAYDRARQADPARKRAAYHCAWRAAHADYPRAYQAAHREEIAAKQRAYRHNITPDEFDGLGDYQEWLCAGCGAPITPLTAQVDHDHSCCPGVRSCGKCIRGLVCQPCNVRDALGTA